jgi:hypothetical protein
MACVGRFGERVLVVIALVGCGGSSLKPSNGAGGHGGATESGSGGASAGDAAADVLPACSGTCVVPFASSSDWAAYDDDPASNSGAQLLGNAQPVCLNASSPPSCPAGAVLYGFGSGWGLDLSSTPGALWIWGPGTTPSAPADLKRFAFSQTFVLGATPSGMLKVAADDMAEVRVNGHSAGTTGSVADVTLASQANSALKSFDLTPLLVPGTNTITVVAQNGQPSFAGCSSACTYSMNPAGVVFGGSLTYH